MLAQPTTTVTIYGGTTTDDLGDETDNTVVSASGLPASILERRVLPTTPADDHVQVIRFFTGRVRADAAITTGNRLLDERTGEIYVIDNVSKVGSSLRRNDLRLDLRRAT